VKLSLLVPRILPYMQYVQYTQYIQQPLESITYVDGPSIVNADAWMNTLACMKHGNWVKWSRFDKCVQSMFLHIAVNISLGLLVSVPHQTYVMSWTLLLLILLFIFNCNWVDTRWQQCSTHLHKQYTQYSSAAHIYTQTVHTIQQYSTHLHKQYTQYSSTAHIYTQTVHKIQQ
jgi:hypothetical protein